jgi:hypothetical protein
MLKRDQKEFMSIFGTADAALTRAGIKITSIVGTMWCAVAFALIALYGLPGALAAGQFVSWLAQTFLQLVLLSIIMVGQAVGGAKTEARDIETHDAVMAEHAEKHAASMAEHAETQEILSDLRAMLEKGK